MNVPNKNTNDKCPKCASEMIKHPSLLSMPLTSMNHSNAEGMKTTKIEDQEANFIFKFNSCKKCGFSEFYLNHSSTKVSDNSIAGF